MTEIRRFKLKTGLLAELKGPSGKTYRFGSKFITLVGFSIDADRFKKLENIEEVASKQLKKSKAKALDKVSGEPKSKKSKTKSQKKKRKG